MGKEIPEPLTGELAYKYDLTNEGGTGRKIRFLKNIMGLWIEQESRRQWAREGEKISFDELSNMAMASKPLACFINPDDLVFQTPGNMPETHRGILQKDRSARTRNQGRNRALHFRQPCYVLSQHSRKNR